MRFWVRSKSKSGVNKCKLCMWKGEWRLVQGESQTSEWQYRFGNFRSGSGKARKVPRQSFYPLPKTVGLYLPKTYYYLSSRLESSKKIIFNKISKFSNENWFDIFGAILVNFYAKYFESLKNISLHQNLRAQSLTFRWEAAKYAF